MPSGLRILGFLIWREKVIPGLFLGALLTNFIYHPDLVLPKNIAISLISAYSGPLTCYLVEYIKKTNLLSTSLKFSELIYLCVTYAFINALLHFLEFILFLQHLKFSWKHFVEMFIGDINGILVAIIILKTFIYCLKLISKRHHF